MSNKKRAFKSPVKQEKQLEVVKEKQKRNSRMPKYKESFIIADIEKNQKVLPILIFNFL